MSHTQGPYYYLPRFVAKTGFVIYEAKNPDLPPIAVIPRNTRSLEEVEATAKMLTAAPLMLSALQALATLPLDGDVLQIVDHAVRVAIEGVRGEEPKSKT